MSSINNLNKILKMPPFIPDVPYKVQAIFICTFYYIWSTAFTDDYLEPMPLDTE